MMKYNFLLLSSQHEEFLEKLASLGIIDVTINSYDVEDNEKEMLSKLTKYSTVLSNLKNISNTSESNQQDDFFKTKPTAVEIVAYYDEITRVEEELKVKISSLNELYSNNSCWGAFDKNAISNLKELGVSLRFFAVSNKSFNEEFQLEHPVEKISEERGIVYFVYVQRDNDEIIESIKECREMPAPVEDIRSLIEKIDQASKFRDENQAKLTALSSFYHVLESEIDSLKDNIHFYKIKNSNTRVAEGSLISIEGWAPKEQSSIADSYLNTLSDVIVFKEDPNIEDEPPVLLRNNKFATSLEIITKLYALPRYNEVDMTPFLAPFFVFFVGMCIGDAGYGLLLLVGSLIVKFSGKAKGLSQVINLVFWCSLATIFMGLLTGVFFGLELATFSIFEPVKGLFIPTNSMFGFALAVGMVQILYAIILRSIIRIRRFGFVYGLAGLGWVITIISTLSAIALPKAGIDAFTTSSISYQIILALSMIMMLFFQNPKKGILMNFGIGLWELYNNVTGLLGDILSYVRLFALGLCGGVIAGIFNKLAIGMSGDIPVVKYLIMILIILIGHSINLFMSVIGSFVHPLRLTFVEFYKNVGFEGGGRGYNPFFKRSDDSIKK